MASFTVTLIKDELIGTFDDGKYRFVVKQNPTGDFPLDCACLLDTISVKISNLDKGRAKNGIVQ